MDCSRVLSTWGLDLGFLCGLFVILPLLYFVYILRYFNFGKGLKSLNDQFISLHTNPMLGGLMAQQGELGF
jgi:hypothetical protein